MISVLMFMMLLVMLMMIVMFDEDVMLCEGLFVYESVWDGVVVGN